MRKLISFLRSKKQTLLNSSILSIYEIRSFVSKSYLLYLMLQFKLTYLLSFIQLHVSYESVCVLKVNVSSNLLHFFQIRFQSLHSVCQNQRSDDARKFITSRNTIICSYEESSNVLKALCVLKDLSLFKASCLLIRRFLYSHAE